MPDSLTQLTVEGVTSVYTAAFMLTVAAWALGWKIGVVCGVIKKL